MLYSIRKHELVFLARSQATAIGATESMTSLLNASTNASDDALSVINTGTYLTGLTGNILGGVAAISGGPSSNPTTGQPTASRNGTNGSTSGVSK